MKFATVIAIDETGGLKSLLVTPSMVDAKALMNDLIVKNGSGNKEAFLMADSFGLMMHRHFRAVPPAEKPAKKAKAAK